MLYFLLTWGLPMILLIGFGPVSYTHLDVYKRQAEEYGCSGDLIAGANIAGFLKVAESVKAQGIAY